MESKDIIYLDNNATTPIDPRVLDGMMPYLTNLYGNASSRHKFGMQADIAVKNARKQVSDLIGCEINELIFTSGATESINLAIKGIAENYKDKGKHIVTILTEHSAVLDTCKELEKNGYEVTYLPVKSDGLLDLDIIEKVIRKDTILVSVMYVNNETGVIQPIKEIAEITHKAGSIFMTDATQAVGKLRFNVNDMGIDVLTMSAHKIYGPKGIGVLYFKNKRPNKVRLKALIHGGGHEKGYRSGTLNVPGIVGLGAACEYVDKEMDKNEKHIRELRDYLERELLNIENTSLNGNKESRLYNVSNICFKGISSEALIIGLDNIMVSNGSACSSSLIEPSHVLKAMGQSDKSALSSIRISLSKANNIYEINHALITIKKTLLSISSLNF